MIHVIDYGVGNVGSVINMIKKVGGTARACSDSDELRRAHKLLLPGVGSFDAAVERLHELRLPTTLRECAQSGTPLLGICLGMQLLADGSEEGVLPGLGLIPGRVRRFAFTGPQSKLKVPHMGWNHVNIRKVHPLLHGLDHQARFYFVHSYYYVCAYDDHTLLNTTYGHSFVSGVQHKNIMGVQFHPEKSHRYGMQLIKNFVEL